MKLTRTFKENLIDKAVNKTMEAKEKQHKDKVQEFAKLCYSLMYSPEQLAAMKRLPAGWLPTETSLRISLSDNLTN